MRHAESVSSAAFSPDGARVVTVSGDTARVWDAFGGKPLGEPMRHEALIWSAAFSPDGTRVVTASNDKTARLWDASSGKPFGAPMRHEGDVFRAAFSRDGTRVGTASADRSARVWDASSGKPLGEPMRHDRAVWSAAFSPDGTRVVTAGEDETARVWDGSSGKPLGEPMRHEESVSSAWFSPDGTRVVTASDNTARVWDVAVPVPQGGRSLLADLNELAAGQWLGPSGGLELLPEGLAARRAKLVKAAKDPATPPAVARWLRWFLADPRHRTISPLSNLSVEEWAQNRVEENTPEGLQAAWEIDPTHAMCLARRARLFALAAPPDAIDAQLHSNLALKLAPQDAEVQWRRAAVLALLGKPREAAELADRCPQPAAGNLWAWEAKWETCTLLGRDGDAKAARQQVDELARTKPTVVRQSVKACMDAVSAAMPKPATTQPAGT